MSKAYLNTPEVEALAGRDIISDEGGGILRKALRPKEPLPIMTSGFLPIGFRLVKLKHLIRMPKVSANHRRPGVYFLFKEKTLIYIGSSRNIRERIQNHSSSKKIEFDQVTCMSIEFPWYLSVEAAYIEAYMPILNIRHCPRGIERAAIDEHVRRSAALDDGIPA